MENLNKEEEGFLKDFRNITKCDYLEYVSKNEHIVKLNLKNISLQSLPVSIGDLNYLEELNIEYDREEFPFLNTLPNSLGNLQSLQILTINGCRDLTSIPAKIGNLKPLKTLIIKNCNSLGVLPLEFMGLEGLERLDLSFCDFREIPVILFSLKNLNDLNLTGNGIDEGLGYYKFTELTYENSINIQSYDISIQIDSLEETPQKICLDLEEKVIGKETAINRLRTLYNKENISTYVKVKTIEILGKMQKSFFFNLREEIINEINPLIRGVMIKVFFQNYPEKSLSLLKNTIIIEINPFVLKTLFDMSKIIEDDEFHRIKKG